MRQQQQVAGANTFGTMPRGEEARRAHQHIDRHNQAYTDYYASIRKEGLEEPDEGSKADIDNYAQFNNRQMSSMQQHNYQMETGSIASSSRASSNYAKYHHHHPSERQQQASIGRMPPQARIVGSGSTTVGDGRRSQLPSATPPLGK